MNTSQVYYYLSNFSMTMLFWQRDSLALLAPTMSLTNVGHFFGHSCFKIWKQNETFSIWPNNNKCKNGEEANIQVWSEKKMKVVSCYMLKPNVNDHVFFLIKPGPMERGYNVWILSASQLIIMIQVIGAITDGVFLKTTNLSWLYM